ncbi:MAG: hypothetical protein IPH03_13660 [Tetrasphaera sp.]|nr:hypothetical protein [Tetrasphaera sp.]
MTPGSWSAARITREALLDRRAAGGELDKAAARAQLIDGDLPKVEEGSNAEGQGPRDKAHEKLLAMATLARAHHPPSRRRSGLLPGRLCGSTARGGGAGEWLQYDYGEGPVVDGPTVLFVAWLAWSRFRG